MKRLMTCLVVAGAMAFGGVAMAKEKPAGDKPAGDKTAAVAATLPQAATDAIMKAFPKATIGQATAVGKNGKIFKVAMTEADKPFSIMAAESGVIVSVTTPVAAADLPKVVADAAAAALEGSTVKSAAKVEQRAGPRNLKPLDKPEVSYMITLAKGDQTGVISLGEDGKVTKELRMQGAKKPKDATEPAK